MRLWLCVENVHWSDDVAHHKDKAGHCCLPRNLLRLWWWDDPNKSNHIWLTCGGIFGPPCTMPCALCHHLRIRKIYFEERTDLCVDVSCRGGPSDRVLFAENSDLLWCIVCSGRRQEQKQHPGLNDWWDYKSCVVETFCSDSRRQTLTAISAPEAEVVALSEALIPSVVIHDACCDIGLIAGVTPEILFVIKADSQVTLTQLRNESVTTRSRHFANRFNYAREMCHGTTLHSASVRAVFDGLKAFVSDLGLGTSPLIRNHYCYIPLKPPLWCEACGWA